MREISFLVVSAAMISMPCFSQTEHEPVHVSFFGNISFPSYELKKAVDNRLGGMGTGIGGNMLFNPFGEGRRSPFYFGVDFSYLTFGRDKIAAGINAPPYKTAFNYYAISGVARLFLTNKSQGFAPFVDGMLGLKIFNTRTKIDKDAFDTILGDDQPEVINTTNDTGLGYGLGLGFFNRRREWEEGESRTSFTIRVLYLWGDDTSYVRRGSLQVNNGYISYNQGHTRTDMVLVQFGFSIF